MLWGLVLRIIKVLPTAGHENMLVTNIFTAVQVSGEAQYTDDVALPPNTLHAAFVTSKKPHAKLLGVDASAALAMPGKLSAHMSVVLSCPKSAHNLPGIAYPAIWWHLGCWLPDVDYGCPSTESSMSDCCCFALSGVVGYYGADDVPGDNMIGPIMHDEEVFATKEVTCVGQVRGTVWCGARYGVSRGPTLATVVVMHLALSVNG
jgi:xanthine dehydrogenase molybdopterin-binding subunit B